MFISDYRYECPKCGTLYNENRCPKCNYLWGRIYGSDQKSVVKCPNCLSLNLQCCNSVTTGVKEPVVKSRTTTKLNLNPLKPFTLFNEKSKTKSVGGSDGILVTTFRCSDCGTMFEIRQAL